MLRRQTTLITGTILCDLFTTGIQIAVEAKNALAALESDPSIPAQDIGAKTKALELAEERAAAAMKECELAVKEEMQAQAVVKVKIRCMQKPLHGCMTACIHVP